MPDPINYASMIQPPNFGEMFSQGMQIGQGLHDRFKTRPLIDKYRELQLAEAVNQQQRQEQWKVDLQGVLSDPTPDGYQQLFAKYPEQHDALKQSWGVYSGEKQSRNLKAATAVYGYISAGAPDKAVDLLEKRKVALTQAGEETAETDALIELLKSGDPAKIQQAKGIAGLVLSASSDPDKVGQTLSDLSKGAEAKVVGEGGALVDATGKVLYENPKKSGDFTLSPGETRYSGTAGVTGPSPGATTGGKLDPKSFFKDFVLKHEGGFNPSDANGSPTNFGINQASNPDVDVSKLTPDGAADIFTNKYWEKSGAGNLPPALAAVHADTAYINPSQAQKFLAASGGDPQKYMQMRETWMKSLVAKSPDKFKKYEKAWGNRNADLRAYSQELAGGGGAPAGAGSGASVIAAAPAKPGYTLMTPDENKSLGLDPNVRFQRGPEGQITALGGQEKSQGQLKPTPQAPAKSILENRSTLREIDRAIALLSKNPDAIGYWKGKLPDAVTQRTDAAGVPVRAAIGKIGGKIIHDVSGAAVTLSEAPRFQPYVPSTGDTAETALSKLKQLRALAAADSADLDAAWGPDNGYRGVKLPGDGTKGPVKVRSVQEAMKLAPGTIFQTPDGRLKRR